MASQQSEGAAADQKPASKTDAPADQNHQNTNGVNGHSSPSQNGLTATDTATKIKSETPAKQPSKADSELGDQKEDAVDSKQGVTVDSKDAEEEKDTSATDVKDDVAAETAEAQPSASATDATTSAESAQPADDAKASMEVKEQEEDVKDTEMADAPVDAPVASPSAAAATSALDTNVDQSASTDPTPNAAEATEGAKDSSASVAAESTAGDSSQLQPSISKLAIDASQSASETADTSMTDAPSQSSKVAREREDDATEEPAAKRARTEPPEVEAETKQDGEQADKEDATSQSAPASESRQPAEESSKPQDSDGKDGTDQMNVDDITREGLALLPPYPPAPSGTLMHPSADKNPISTHGNREIRKALASVKKTKAGMSFKDSVAALWPVLAESYAAKIAHPMDIGQMERSLRSGKYRTLGEFKDDLKLLVVNSYSFNGPDHEVTKQAVQVVDNVWGKLAESTAEEPSKQSSKKDAKPATTRHTERAAAHPRPKPVSTPALVPPPAPKPAPKPAAPPVVEKVVETPIHAAPPARRDSTKDDDRPKRPIHPPKKDLGYEPKGTKKKKLSPDLKFCDDLLKEITKPKHQEMNFLFLRPVDEVRDGAPGYFDLIKKPMDLQTINTKLQAGDYRGADEFRSDFLLMLNNCFTFNPKGTEVYNIGQKLKRWYDDKWSSLDTFVAKASSSKAPPRRASASSPSAGAKGDSDDEGPASEPELEPEAADSDEISSLRKIIDALQTRINEQREEQVKELKSDTPDMAKADITHSIIMMLSKDLGEKKKKLEELLASRPAPKPKPAQKPKKAAAASNSAPVSKKAASGTVKKSGGGSKKSGPKRPMTSIEKEAIANGINDLDGAYIAQAIEVIKKDTHQEENNDGELELEIEQLSTDALHKLYDIMCKGIKGFKSKVEAQLKESQAAAAPASSAVASAIANRTQKPKKNKPMGKGEQERKLEQLANLKAQYKQKGRQSSGSQEPPPSNEVVAGAAEPAHGDDDDSDVSSEED